ncbi:MAG: hypothetical protein ACMX3H_02505 [Sodalis sp. (in: enterobacteria)]|uniref:gp53-like domain-containing protein n=1 Tax=Sodalis sp. (in: enterobacteria) TaxID=1898979 RepID=UPI0039E2D089
MVEGNAKFTGTDYLDKSGVITEKKNNVRETNGLRIRGIEGQRANFRYFEQIGQGASLKLNVIAGNDNGEFTFSQRGNFRASGGATFGGNIHVAWGGRTAIFHENGDVTGPIWGGALSAWLNNQLQGRARTQVFGGRGGWWYKDELSGFIFQGGGVKHVSNAVRVSFPLGYQRECFGVQMTFLGNVKSDGISAAEVENSGFTAWMHAIGTQSYWWAVGV